MAILAECPLCHRKQSTKNKLCHSCSKDLVKAKRSKKVRYWIDYRLPGGRQRKEYVGYSIEEAQAAEGKRKAQKYESPRILEKAIEEKSTFQELTEWYLDLPSVRKKRSYRRDQECLANLNKALGDLAVAKITPVDLEKFQDCRENQGAASATIDMELSITKRMISKAFDNDMVSGHTLKVFRRCERKLKKGGNVRRRVITPSEFTRLVSVASPHLKAFLLVAYCTGMRTGELRLLRWKHVDFKKGFIRLPAEITKEQKPKTIPMNRYVVEVLKGLPRALHHDFVFTYRGEPIRERGGLKNSFRTACRKAEIPCGRKEMDGITFHDIRRTVKTNMLNAGIDRVHRDIILGHSLQGMDAHYMAPSEEDMHRAMEKYTTWIEEQGVFATVAQNVAQNEKTI